jgi:hypothetical protein
LQPHRESEHSCAEVLQLRALAELEAGQSEAALADIDLALSLTGKVRSEPFLLSHLVRIAMFRITAQPIWEALVNHRFSEAQLSALERELARFDFVADYQAAMRAEIVGQAAGIEYLRKHPAEVFTICDARSDESATAAQKLLAHIIPSALFYQNELCTAEFMLEQMLPIGDASRQTISPTRARQAEKSFEEMRGTYYTVLCKMLTGAETRNAQRFAFAQAAVNLARTACALERYRLAHGEYPATLEVLAPQFIAKLPCDPIDGEPLRYRLTDQGEFILYSIGWNEKDDGGTVKLTSGGAVDLDNGDWVWRAPERR